MERKINGEKEEVRGTGMEGKRIGDEEEWVGR
jgi:hypothetical protein